MKRLLGVSTCGALLMTAWLGAAPSPSSVADAAMKGDRDAVRALLKQGADVSAAKGDGMTALHFAAERGDAAMTEMLVYAGANVSAVTRIGQYTPLHLAAASGNGEVVALLLDHGADADARESEWGQTPLMFAAADNRVAAIHVLLERGADATIKTRTIDIAHQSALDRAASDRQKKVLEASVPKGQRPTPRQVQAAIEASRELFASGKIPPPEEKPAAGRGGRGGNGDDANAA